ncbi:TRAP transporter TAXI family solute receptor [Kitasatospora sp. MAP12-15]|uniref:TAXI family TRAP transporter solute-binding subunit n=1 Tax=unclassified Kitasatospora TaxID=2633591 RepID=UPI00247593D6|nr:TAXI family TRAP transporter solute-binding subunit [Kitasatospora sp. MAP12-44]MDH6113071.1 TRAP transporter TAXI family solute receptor [Kitasatospora sp. MAP12-44]
MTPSTGRLSAAARSRPWRAAAALLLVVGALAGWWLDGGGTPSYPRGTYGFATGVQSGVYDKYGQLLSGYLHTAMPGVQLRLDASQGSVDNLERVTQGKDDFAIATADAVADFNETGSGQLRAIARLYDDYLQLIVPADSTVTQVSQLRGKKVGVGQPKSGVNLVTRQLLSAAGIDPDSGIVPEPLGVEDAANQLQSGEINAFFWSGGLPTGALSDLSERFPIRLVPLGDLVDALHKEGGDTGAYRAAVLPADVYPKAQPFGTPVLTMAVPNLLITRADVDPLLVERITQAVIDSRDSIGSQVHAAQVVDRSTAVYTDPLPLHEGAKRYYRSAKP